MDYLAHRDQTFSDSAAKAQGTPSPQREEDRDAILLSQIARGDVAALEALYNARGGILFALCRRILNGTEAEDALEEVFWEIWKRADRYNPERGSGINYLLTLTRSRAIDCRRNRERTTRLMSPSTLSPDELTAASVAHSQVSVSDPLADAQTKELRAAVREAIARLSVAQREALQLAYFDGMTQSEIAQRLSEPLGTIKTRMRSALVHLREMLTPLINPGQDSR